MRLLLGYFLLVAVAAWFVWLFLSKKLNRACEEQRRGRYRYRNVAGGAGASRFALWGPTHGQLAQAFNQLQHRPFRAKSVALTKCAMNIMSI